MVWTKASSSQAVLLELTPKTKESLGERWSSPFLYTFGL